jgi:hypothetical protein
MSLLRLRTSLVLNSRVTKNAIVWHTAATAPLQGVGFPIQLGIRVVARTRAQVHCELLTGYSPETWVTLLSKDIGYTRLARSTLW